MDRYVRTTRHRRASWRRFLRTPPLKGKVEWRVSPPSNDHPTINAQDLTGNVGGLVGREERHRIGNLLRRAPAPFQGHQAAHALQRLLAIKALVEGSLPHAVVDHARRYRIDPHTGAA